MPTEINLVELSDPDFKEILENLQTAGNSHILNIKACSQNSMLNVTQLLSRIQNLSTLIQERNNPKLKKIERNSIKISIHSLRISDIDFSTLKENEIFLIAKLIGFCSRIEALTLKNCNLNKMKPAFFNIICKAIQNNKFIKDLNLAGNYLGNLSTDQPIQYFIETIAAAQNLITLNLAHNNLGEQDGHFFFKLAAVIRYFKRIKNLDLSFNGFSNLPTPSFQKFADFIKQSPHLASLNLSGNYFGLMIKEKSVSTTEKMDQEYYNERFGPSAGEKKSHSEDAIIDEEKHTLLCAALSCLTELKYLGLKSCGLSHQRLKQWQSCINALAALKKLTHLELSDNNLGQMKDANILLLISQLLERHPSLTKLECENPVLQNIHKNKLTIRVNDQPLSTSAITGTPMTQTPNNPSPAPLSKMPSNHPQSTPVTTHPLLPKQGLSTLPQETPLLLWSYPRILMAASFAAGLLVAIYHKEYLKHKAKQFFMP